MIDEDYSRILREKAAEGDVLYLLNELLAVIHRDGGQYTILAGLAVSTQDAMGAILDLRNRLRHAEYIVRLTKDERSAP